VRFVIPVGYPAAQPDCFWADENLRLASGAIPTNAAAQMIPGTAELALWFSWHFSGWRPSQDDLMTYIRFVLMRFIDAR
jgi:hypothetical protein